MGIIIERYKSNNKHSKTYGRTYGRVKAQGKTVDIRQLARHVQTHGSIYTYDTIVGVLAKVEQCLPELITAGRKVKLEGLGTFYLTARTIGEENPGDFTASNIRSLRLRFLPDQANYSVVATNEVTRSGMTEGIAITDYYVEEGAGGSGSGSKKKRVIVYDRGEDVPEGGGEGGGGGDDDSEEDRP